MPIDSDNFDMVIDNSIVVNVTDVLVGAPVNNVNVSVTSDIFTVSMVVDNALLVDVNMQVANEDEVSDYANGRVVIVNNVAAIGNLIVAISDLIVSIVQLTVVDFMIVLLNV